MDVCGCLRKSDDCAALWVEWSDVRVQGGTKLGIKV